MTQALGEELGVGYVVVRMKVTPKTEKPLSISPDDFTIVCRKDGQRSVGAVSGTDRREGRADREGSTESTGRRRDDDQRSHLGRRRNEPFEGRRKYTRG